MNEEKPNYYAIIPASVRYDIKLKANEKLLYGEITALSNKTGECHAGNKYFAELYEVKIETISRWIKHLKDLGYIETQIIYKNDTKEIEKRIIKINDVPIDKKINTYIPNSQEGIDEKVKENNTSINNTLNLNKFKVYRMHSKKSKFIKPTVEEIREYCLERKNGIDANTFYDFYESKGWKVGRQSMKDWHAAIRTWENRNRISQNANVPEWFDNIPKRKDIELSADEKAWFEGIANSN